MGCDIHAFIEYKTPNQKYWRSYSGELCLARDYHIFAALAGVRNYHSIDDYIQPRGAPEDLGISARTAYLFFICDKTDFSENCVSKKDAEKWLCGLSKKFDDRYITSPDAHSTGWLNTEEFAKATDSQFKDSDLLQLGDDYLVTLKCLKNFEELGYQARIVFWFDN